MKNTQTEILHQYKGQGTLSIENEGPITCDFEFTQNQDGTLRLHCAIELAAGYNPSRVALFRKPTRFEGHTTDGLLLKSESLYYGGYNFQYTFNPYFLCSQATLVPIENSQEDVHSIVVPLVNLNLCCETTEDLIFANGLTVQWQQTPLEIDGQLLTIRPLPDISDTIQRLKETRAIAVTCEAVAPLASLGEVGKWKERLTILSSLLTFYYGTRINWIGYDVLSASGSLLKRECISLPTSGYGAHVSESSWSTSVWARDQRAFMKGAYERFGQLGENWDLYAVVNLFTDLRGQIGYSEVAGLQLASCLEIINCTYMGRTERKNILKQFDKKVKPELKKAIREEMAKMIVDITSLTGEELKQAEESNQELAEKTEMLLDNLINVNHYPFARALREICVALEFEPSEEAIERFKKNRNSLVHTGLFNVTKDGLKTEKLPARQKWDWYSSKHIEANKELRFMEDFVGKLILSAFGVPSQLNEC